MRRWARYKNQHGKFWVTIHYDSDLAEFDSFDGNNHWVRDGSILFAYDWDVPKATDSRWEQPQQMAPRA